jgi:hypothetical protein
MVVLLLNVIAVVDTHNSTVVAVLVEENRIALTKVAASLLLGLIAPFFPKELVDLLGGDWCVVRGLNGDVLIVAVNAV